ncbi:MAG TPA: enoyl-CoA hydratase/isomerase family protein [Pseudolabrys sp.]|nr:enoyl-CoA hydratase/isomerase family protein [Pseudolabrys sp.]
MVIGAKEILFERRGVAAIVTLNRPQALNALSRVMVLALRAQLDGWAADAAVKRVVIQAAGGRAFCAGGDIREIYDLHKAGRIEEAIDFWRHEYPLNAAIKHYPKPYIALVDGLVMGGGVGVSMHGALRVAGDRLSFAMPEVGIGFFPDVGATYLLPRLPGKTGTYLALTGSRVGPADAMALGVATHRVATARFPELLEALCENDDAATTLDAFSMDAGSAPLAPHRALIDRAFAGANVEAILAALEREGTGSGDDAAFARAQAAVIRTKCPLSLKIALEQMRRGPKLDFNEAMRTEFRILSRVARETNFYEGIRAAVLDKDNPPRWNPPSLAQVSEAAVAAHFAPLAEELAL